MLEGGGCGGLGWGWGSLLVEASDYSVSEVIYLYIGLCNGGDVEKFFYSEQATQVCKPQTVPASQAGPRVASGWAQQLPPWGTAFASASPAHLSVQVESAPQVTEHSPVQVTLQVAPSVQDTLPLLPTVVLQVEPPLQSMLHDSPQLPSQRLFSLHSREQLPALQPDWENVQDSPAGQLQVVPVQVTGVGPPSSLLLQPTVATRLRNVQIPRAK